ncbi:hypothetical protein [Rossellomorea vietnamensis]|uniref:hypothetical protein n=1 Tax=Rossellomorea vietnamensis TaxID=218284 RepID=UPI0005526E66|nr:hypothetical protein [Rossellomorea vietnamensis]
MADLPRILEDIAIQKNKQILEKIMIQLTTNNRSFDQDEHKQVMNQIIKGAGVEKSNDKFDRQAFEKLRFLTDMGANKSK